MDVVTGWIVDLVVAFAVTCLLVLGTVAAGGAIGRWELALLALFLIGVLVVLRIRRSRARARAKD